MTEVSMINLVYSLNLPFPDDEVTRVLVGLVASYRHEVNLVLLDYGHLIMAGWKSSLKVIGGRTVKVTGRTRAKVTGGRTFKVIVA